MATGLDISQQFIDSRLLPMLRETLGDDCDRLAVAVVGTGSDVIGLDDEISRDHHWGPRANVMYVREDADRFASKLHGLLDNQLPAEFNGLPLQVNIGNLTGVCHSVVEDFFGSFLGTEQLPQADADWLNLCEVDLFHVTAGTVVHDGLGEFTCRRDSLSYYPDNVWKKRLADWCMYVTGRDAPYNIHRIAKRGDELTSSIYFGQCLKRIMELCFALNRQYAPYTKWLNQSFRRLPKYADEIVPLIDQAMTEPAWASRVQILVDANYLIAEALVDLGVTERVVRKPFDEGLTDLTLYYSAAEIYAGLPEELLAPSFNQIEYWEIMAREVLFDSNDYMEGAGQA